MFAVVVFIAVSAWWLSVDTRVPDWDSGIHMHFAFLFHGYIAAGHVSMPFTSYYEGYPPLVYLLGALTIFLAGMHPMALILSSNIVFVPLLAIGCYGVGKLVAGPRAGLLAGIFALGSPMFVSMMHGYNLDQDQAAMVALGVWTVLAARRFERNGVSAIAGITCGLALLTKETSIVFLGGLLLAVVARGGWRNQRGLLFFLLTLCWVALPWYAFHLRQIAGTFGSIAELAPNPAQAPPLWSARNATWYLWDLVNQQTLAPLAIAFFIGLALAIGQCLRSRGTRDSYLPELVIGTLVSYLGMTCLTHKDPRYTLPALVYVAVLGTFWIPAIPIAWARRLLIGAAVAVALINFVGMSFGLGGLTARAMVSLPRAGNSIIYPGHLTLYEDMGWLRGAPERNGDALALLRALRREGVRTIELNRTTDQVDFSVAGLLPVVDAEHMVMALNATARPDARFLLLRSVRPGDPAPCQWIRGSPGGIETEPGFPLGIYVLEGSVAGVNSRLLRNPADPAQRYEIACPGRRVVMFP
ncbi:MAG: ArnT family glycosyltransferase [Solirubrobacteraceae bacterium]